MVLINKKVDMKIIETIKQIHKASKGTYGYRRVHAELKENVGFINHKKVARLMRENEIFSTRRIKFKITTKAAKRLMKIDNLLKRNFTVEAPNKVWVSDITYINTKEGWMYLCVIIDLYSRKIVGWHCSSRLSNDLVIHSFMKAYWNRKPGKDLIFHSDRGSQYTSNDFIKVLKNLNVRQSLSKNVA
ncbi:IS3 family transposase [Candidatus Bandiella numerosa]|uniref:IS3 family transposase n=1 Tax=Candidatus Bandiella numerosa TaxID=2570586 RepID=UPI001F027E1F|nr:IS3 family transposase [Candidatus Bandiella numerosa]